MISSISNSANFKGIYYLQKDNFTNGQKIVANDIIKKLMQNNFSEAEKISFLDKYEREGVDFVMKPSPDKNCIDLYAYKNLKKNENGAANFFGNEDKKYVGRYDVISNFFKLKHLEDIYTQQSIPPHMKLFGMMFVAAAIVLIPLISHIRKSINPHYINDSYLKYDTLNNSADTIAKDTIKILPKIK